MAIDEPMTPRRLIGVLKAITDGDDDDDALDRVAHRVRDRVDAAQGQEGDLVVEVVVRARQGREDGQVLLRRAGRDGRVDGASRRPWASRRAARSVRARRRP